MKKYVDIKINAQGRIVIPHEVREVLNIERDQTLKLGVENNSIVIKSQEVLEQELLSFLKEERERTHLSESLVEELIEERRQAAQLEVANIEGDQSE